MNYHFAESIRKNESPYLDVYRGVVMSIVGPLAYRSALDNSSVLNIPDFRIESTRNEYEIDDWSPDPIRSGKGQPWPSIEGKKDITAEALEYATVNWKEIGYTEG